LPSGITLSTNNLPSFDEGMMSFSEEDNFGYEEFGGAPATAPLTPEPSPLPQIAIMPPLYMNKSVFVY
jgi:hypothetical protein